MKIVRSSVLRFKEVDKSKLSIISNFLNEYSKCVNFFIQKFKDLNLSKISKFSLNGKENYNLYQGLNSGLRQQALIEAYGMVLSAQTSKQKKYIIPTHNSKSAIISTASCSHFNSKNIKFFDYILHLKGLPLKGMKLDIPLHKHKQFNKFFNDPNFKINNSITLYKDKVQFSFTADLKKKESGIQLGCDVGINKLISLSDGIFIDFNLKEKIKKLQNMNKSVRKQKKQGQRKKSTSKHIQRYKKFLKTEINRCINQLFKFYPDLHLLVVEGQVSSIKRGMKHRSNASKNFRSFLSNWQVGHMIRRLKEQTEVNRVCFRSVSPYHTSITCHSCGYAEKGNRLNQECFECQKCGYVGNADINAAQNILNRFLTGVYGRNFINLNPVANSS